MLAMLIAVSSIALVLIALGWWNRRRPEVHIPFMASAFAMDIGLLLYIEWNRHAIETFERELHSPTQVGLLFFHVAVSILTLVMYILLIISGVMLFRGNHRRRAMHRYGAHVFVVVRLLNYATSFFVA